MSEPRVAIRFDRPGCTYYPNESLSGEYRVEGVAPEDVKAVEVSVLWCTEGKGDEDLAVHHFERFSPEEDGMHLATFGEFRAELPNSPLSYQGVTIKLDWRVRVRVFVRRGKDAVGEATFRLGAVPPAEAARL